MVWDCIMRMLSGRVVALVICYETLHMRIHRISRKESLLACEQNSNWELVNKANFVHNFS